MPCLGWRFSRPCTGERERQDDPSARRARAPAPATPPGCRLPSSSRAAASYECPDRLIRGSTCHETSEAPSITGASTSTACSGLSSARWICATAIRPKAESRLLSELVERGPSGAVSPIRARTCTIRPRGSIVTSSLRRAPIRSVCRNAASASSSRPCPKRSMPTRAGRQARSGAPSLGWSALRARDSARLLGKRPRQTSSELRKARAGALRWDVCPPVSLGERDRARGAGARWRSSVHPHRHPHGRYRSPGRGVRFGASSRASSR